MGVSPSAFSSTRKCRDEQEEGASAALFPRLRRVSCSLFLSPFVSKQAMTNYHLTPPTMLPSLAVQEAKEKRRRVLEAVRQRRRIIYASFHQKFSRRARSLRKPSILRPGSSLVNIKEEEGLYLIVSLFLILKIKVHLLNMRRKCS